MLLSGKYFKLKMNFSNWSATNVNFSNEIECSFFISFLLILFFFLLWFQQTITNSIIYYRQNLGNVNLAFGLLPNKGSFSTCPFFYRFCFHLFLSVCLTNMAFSNEDNDMFELFAICSFSWNCNINIVQYYFSWISIRLRNHS